MLKHDTMLAEELIETVLEMKLGRFTLHWFQLDCYMLVVVEILS